ncbi:MAG: hypothetical protein EZS28_008940 [Streblomastix strix]|uniref:C2 domain-containing protein n=1 Tax=Streblomastix strix TaxID=222440 RepID=A0A5J4WKF7_9EUKA|nr:MAG: hypothetical protein EZS28_008940 [Streblomastix strix]
MKALINELQSQLKGVESSNAQLRSDKKNDQETIRSRDNEIEDLKKRPNEKDKERKRDDVLDRALAKPDDNLIDVEKEQLPAARALQKKILRNPNVRDEIERAELINVLDDHTQAEDAPSDKFIACSNLLNLIVLANALDDSFSKTANVIVHPMLQLVKSGFRKQSKQANQALSSLIEESPATKECILSNPDAVQTIEQILVAPIIPQKYIIPIAPDEQNIKGEKDRNYNKDNLNEGSQGDLHADPLLDRKIKEHLFPGVVRVEVISAKQLEPTSTDVKSDPYAVVSFAGQQLKTQPIGDNVNVDLNEMKDFQFDPNQTDDRELKKQIRPYENNEQNVEVPLEGKGIKSGTQPGVVELSIDYIPEELQKQNYIDKQKKMNKLDYDDSGDEYFDIIVDIYNKNRDEPYSLISVGKNVNLPRPYTILSRLITCLWDISFDWAQVRDILALHTSAAPLFHYMMVDVCSDRIPYIQQYWRENIAQMRDDEEDEEENEEDQDKRCKQKKDQINDGETLLNLADQYDTFTSKSHILDNAYTHASSIVISSYFPIVIAQQ